MPPLSSSSETEQLLLYYMLSRMLSRCLLPMLNTTKHHAASYSPKSVFAKCLIWLEQMRMRLNTMMMVIGKFNKGPVFLECFVAAKLYFSRFQIWLADVVNCSIARTTKSKVIFTELSQYLASWFHFTFFIFLKQNCYHLFLDFCDTILNLIIVLFIPFLHI